MSSFPPNPYQATSFPPTPPPDDAWGGFSTQLKILGGINIGIGLIGLIFGAMSVLGNIMTIANGGPVVPPNTPDAGVTGFWIGFYGVFIAQAISTILQPIVIFAGINMIRAKGGSVMWAGSIINAIPLVSACCFLGVPFGIWGMILLSNKTVKARVF